MTTQANVKIYQALVKHHAYLLRLISGQQDEFLKIINKGNPDLSLFLIENIDGLKTGINKTAQKSFEVFGKKLYKLRQSGVFDVAQDKYSKELLTAIDNESKYMQALYTNSVGIKEWGAVLPKTDPVNLLNYGTIDGKVFDQYFTDIKYGDSNRIINTVRTGMIEQKAKYQIVNDIIGTKSSGYADGIIQTSRNVAKQLARTVTMGIMNNSREEFYKANSDIIKNETFVAVLDGRTTIECGELDGQIFKVGQGPIPPLHRQCRSLRVGEVDGIEILGSRPSITDTRTRRVREINFRADAKAKVGATKWKSYSVTKRNSLIKSERTAWTNKYVGKVPIKTTYEQFLRNSDVKFQNEVLGTKQAELFRKSEMPLSKFIDSSGIKYNVDQLYSLYSNLFTKYGIKR